MRSAKLRLAKPQNLRGMVQVIAKGVRHWRLPDERSGGSSMRRR